MLCWYKYACRKTLADNRPRIRGRFARNEETGETPKVACSTRDENEEELWVFVLFDVCLLSGFIILFRLMKCSLYTESVRCSFCFKSCSLMDCTGRKTTGQLEAHGEVLPNLSFSTTMVTNMGFCFCRN